MNLQEKMVAILSAAQVAKGQIFPHVAPNSARAPYITYFRLSESPENTLDGQPSHYHTSMQLDCMDFSYSGVLAMAEAVEQAFASPDSGLHCYLNLSQDLYAPETGEYRVLMNFSFWHQKEL
ncbi:MAG: DUF3168 domain-containing protein [Magnetococcales bacterium]|nr:DUF3168 domain-containing protein [Magnetococcales bacterium]